MPVPLPSGFKSKEEYAAYMREYRKRKKRRKEFAKQRIIQFLKLIGKFDDEFIKLISDSEFEDNLQIFIHFFEPILILIIGALIGTFILLFFYGTFVKSFRIFFQWM